MPGFGMGGAEEGGVGQSGDGAGVFPEGKEPLAVETLSVAGEDKLVAGGGKFHDGRRGGDGFAGRVAGSEVGKGFEDGRKEGEEGVALGRVDGELQGGSVEGPAGEGGSKGFRGGAVEGEEKGGGTVEVENEGAGVAVVGEAEWRADRAARARRGRGAVGPSVTVGDGLEDGEGEHGGFQGLTRVLQRDG